MLPIIPLLGSFVVKKTAPKLIASALAGYAASRLIYDSDSNFPKKLKKARKRGKRDGRKAADRKARKAEASCQQYVCCSSQNLA